MVKLLFCLIRRSYIKTVIHSSRPAVRLERIDLADVGSYPDVSQLHKKTGHEIGRWEAYGGTVGRAERGETGCEGRGGGGSFAEEISAHLVLQSTQNDRTGRLFGSTNKQKHV